jgi:tetratricopeptide (TPR) repeat protein
MDLTPEQRLQAASLAWSAGNREMAQNQAALASKDPGMKAEALAFETQMLWSEGKYEEAEKLSDRTEQEYRTQESLERAARYAMEFAALQRSEKRVAAAKQRMLRTISEYPAYAPAYFQTAQFFHDDSVELELFYLKKARDLSPDNQDYRKTYANRLLETNHLKEAEAAFSELLNAGGADREAFLGLARCRLAAGDRPGALEILQQAVQRAVTSDQIYYQLGQLYASIGEYEKAALAYIDYSKATPGSVDGWNLAGDAYVNLGRYLYARDQYRKALAIDPANKHAIDALANLDLIGQ